MAIKYTITASVDGVVQMRSCATAICLPILSRHAQKWNSKIPPNIMVVEAVITFAAISYSETETDQIQILSNSRQYPWLLQNLRNTGLTSMMTDVTDGIGRRELISLLFLIVYALNLRGSATLAAQYISMITESADFCLCASALTAIAPALGNQGFRTIRNSLLAPQTQLLELSDTDYALVWKSPTFSRLQRRRQYLLKNYDPLGFPDPNILAILLLLSKRLSPDVRMQLQHLDLKLN